MTPFERPAAVPAGGDDGTVVIAPAGLRRRLGEVLVSQGALGEAALDSALEAQRSVRGPRRRLGQVLVDLGLCTEREVATALGELLDLDVVDLARTTISPDVVRLLPQPVASRLRAVPLAKDGARLRLASADPTNVVSLDDVKLYTGCTQLTVQIATESQIRDLIARSWSLTAESMDVTTKAELEIESPLELDNGASANEAPTVRLVAMIVTDAVRSRASDIHIEPQPDGVRVRYRVDGVLRDVMLIPRSSGPAVVGRIKIVSGLDIAERRMPQDGRTRFVVDGSSLDARISTLPSLLGEKVVIRLLSRAGDVPKLGALGLDPAQEATIRAALAMPQGLVLITGPTGSGKTNTLYSAIQEVASPEKNIVTLEDPVEMQFPGITQVQVHERIGMTFDKGLRSVLRQDPDIVLVGEIRDAETAELALKASLTGHLVLATLHTNSAVGALARLVDMGVEPFLVASSLSCVVAQRLVRLPCRDCVRPAAAAELSLAKFGIRAAVLEGATPVQAVGCQECGQTGYRGRTGVFEVLEVTDALRAVLVATPTEAAVGAVARAAAMTTLRSSALEKARLGRTTFDEAARVTHTDRATGLHCPTCEKTVEPKMLVCPFCTAELQSGCCAGCGRDLDADWQVCPWCRLVPGVEVALPVEVAPPVEVALPAPAAPAKKGAAPVKRAAPAKKAAIPVKRAAPAKKAAPAPAAEPTGVQTGPAEPVRTPAKRAPAARRAPRLLSDVPESATA